MDWLEMREEQAIQATEDEIKCHIKKWTYPIGTWVTSTQAQVVINGEFTFVALNAKTTSVPYRKWPLAVVDVEGYKAVPLRDLAVQVIK